MRRGTNVQNRQLQTWLTEGNHTASLRLDMATLGVACMHVGTYCACNTHIAKSLFFNGCLQDEQWLEEESASHKLVARYSWHLCSAYKQRADLNATVEGEQAGLRVNEGAVPL